LLHRIITKKEYSQYHMSKTVQKMLQALKYLHDRNIIHRDIGPDAFFYRSENNSTLKLFEFGLAKHINPEETYSFRAGTPYFMAPEVVLNAKPRTVEICKKADLWSLGVTVFLMLSGQFPFSGISKDEIFEKVLTKEIKLKNSIPADAKDFMMKLLERDPKARLSVDDALEHSWIMNSGKRDRQVIESAVEALRVFHAQDSIQRALERIAAETVNSHDENHYKELFGKFDANGDGCITRSEFVRALEMDNIYRARAEQIADEVMGGESKLINYAEFRDLMILREMTSDQYRMDAVFTVLDLNGDGHISLQELIAALPNSDSKTITKCISDFQKADGNKDDLLSFSEFTKMFDAETQEKLNLKEIGEIGRYHRINDSGKYCKH